MKIVKVKIKEFGHLKDFDANFDGNIVLLKGDNGRFKSTVMRFIEIALGKSTNIPPNAQGEGEVVTNKNGEQYLFKVKFDKNGKAKLEVTKPDGLRDTTKGAIREIVGAMDFNPNHFVELSKSEKGRKEQIAEFKGRLPVEIQTDLAKWEKDNVANEEERTDLGRDLKRAKGALESHPLFNSCIWKGDKYMLKHSVEGKMNDYSFDHFTKTDISESFAELKAQQEHNALFEKAVNRKDTIVSDRENKKKEIAELETKLKAANERLTEMETSLQTANEWLGKKENHKIDTSLLEKKIEEAESNNLLYEQVQSLKKHIADKEGYEANVGELTTKIEMNRQSISDVVKETAGQVMDGMSFDENSLLYNGTPVHPDCMSTSEIMELGVRMKYLENPEAPLFIENTNLIGEKRWETIKAFAKEHDMQIIGEEVVRGQEKLTVEISS